jgi:hypothetical protein
MNDRTAVFGHPEPVSNAEVSVASQHAPSRAASPLGEIFAGLVVIIASIYLITGSYADLPVVTAGYGAALGLVARHMWKHGSPRSLRWLCAIFSVTAIALAIFGAIT